MPLQQFTRLEIGDFFTKLLPLISRRKIKFLLLYLVSVVYLSLPSFSIPVLEYNSFRFTSLMEQRALEAGLLFYPRQSWTSIGDVHPNVLKGIISMEDGSFFNHKGIDWKELKNTLRAHKRRGRTARGASTITMQTAKNLFLTTDKSLLRKVKEFVITFRMEKELSKRAILQNYINAIEWGDGIFGIKKASDVYFNKEPKQLTRNESARLAAVIPSPLRFKPNTNSGYVLRRSSIIMGRMNDVILFPDKKL